MKVYAIKVHNKEDAEFGYEDETVDFYATKELALKILEEIREDYEEFEGNELYIEEIHVREE